MGRELRFRTSRPSYANLLRFDDEEIAEPSQKPVYVDEADSDSEFAPDERASEPDPEELVPVDVDNEDDQEEFGTVGADIQYPLATSVDADNSRTKAKAHTSKKKKSDKEIWRTPTSFPPGLLRPANRQMYALPSPSVHHRHRAIPLYSRAGRVERLDDPPAMFGPPKLALTNGFTSNSATTDRLSKAWGYNVGAGPLWDLMEDRGWFKEAIGEETNEEKEGSRRPRVYPDVRVKDGWEILDFEHASPYLPTDIITTDEGHLKPPPPVVCSFGPFGQQTRTTMNMFDSIRLSEFIPESKSHVLNAGAPVWGLDWCPIHPDDRSNHAYKHYLAVAPFPSRGHSPEIGVRVSRPSYACVQIWSLRPTRAVDSAANLNNKGKESASVDDHGEMRCEIVLCLEGGPAHELKWCPLPSHDNKSTPEQSSRPRKLGILAGSFEDGSLSIYAVPHPDNVVLSNQDLSRPVFVRLPEPLLRLQLEETACWALDWANSEVIAVGCTNGCIAVYDVGQALKAGDGRNIYPTHYVTIHQSAIRALAWIRAPPASPTGAPVLTEDPTVIASGGYDGVECLTDIREPHGNVMNRTRDVIHCLSYSPYSGGPVTIDHENLVKAYSVSPSMLGRGQTLLDPNGPVWTIGVSDYHPQLAVGVADGSCLTTNVLRFTRRGGSVPFFVYKIYQLDYSRTSGEFRMLERFLPQELQDRSAQVRTQRDKSKVDANPVGTGVWPREVGIHRVVWNDGGGLAGAPLLASASASGLCRVDWLMGRWIKDKIPYGSVTNIRKEVDAMDDDGSPVE